MTRRMTHGIRLVPARRDAGQGYVAVAQSNGMSADSRLPHNIS